MADLSGTTFGQYQLVEPISSGGMATVYQAYQPGLDRMVAIKVLPEYLLSQAGFLERFKIEAQAIAKLDHPHILPVYDYGEAERTPYLVMKYVPGGTLKDLITKGPIAPRQAAPLLRQMAEALQHAHQQGVIHRDVKPSNVLLQDGRWVQLMDFGLAKMMTSTSNITASGTGVGTPDYMSPEQAQGMPVDQRADIYSLGVVVYQMLTGDVPFHAETPMAVMLKQIVEPPPPLRLKNPDISPEIEQVALKALAKAREGRYTHALEFAEAYEFALDSAATLPTVQSPGGPTLPITPAIDQRRSPRLIGLGVITALAIVIALVALILSNNRSAPSPASVQVGAVLLDDFSAPTINESTWYYSSTYTTDLTVLSSATSLQNGRVTYNFDNLSEDYLDGGLRHEAPRPFKLISAKVTLLDATGFSDIGLEVNGLDDAPGSWAYLAMSPSDGSVSAYVGHYTETDETFTLIQGSGMPATHELAIGWDGSQLTFYVDGQARKSLPTQQIGQWVWLFFDAEPQGRLSGSFDDVRITYAE
ncbi:eukaryotic-like serine/threonine-protein kinase [Thermoflexales bacterium]|nr:eukaryotic-like serine/threonine-protein kinase [Thermoflexales bacterium]